MRQRIKTSNTKVIFAQKKAQKATAEWLDNHPEIHKKMLQESQERKSILKKIPEVVKKLSPKDLIGKHYMFCGIKHTIESLHEANICINLNIKLCQQKTGNSSH